MRKWLTLVVTVAVVVAGLASSGANSAVGQTPEPDLIAKPGDAIRLAGTRWVYAVNLATPRSKKFTKVITFMTWQTTPAGTPIPNSEVLFIWSWGEKPKSLAGRTYWDSKGLKILPPKAGNVFYAGPKQPTKFVGNPFAVTEKQRRISRGVKIFKPGTETIHQGLVILILQGPGVDSRIVCEYNKQTGDDGEWLVSSCLPLDSQSKLESMSFGFAVLVSSDGGTSVTGLLQFDPTCGCGRKVTP